MGSRPVETTKLILDFVGLSYTSSIKEFLETHTKLPKKPFKSKQQLVRNSNKTTFAWRGALPYLTMRRIQQVCQGAIEMLNLRVFQSKDEYNDGELSVLLPS